MPSPLAVFQLGSFVLHNHMMLNIGWRLSALQGMGGTTGWSERVPSEPAGCYAACLAASTDRWRAGKR
ncbi:MAG: hypothetical protein O2973_08565 [Gemmatimonadetes bacterium]|nr:hypothetical protein [Gemmatimonadota bacterium]